MIISKNDLLEKIKSTLKLKEEKCFLGLAKRNYYIPSLNEIKLINNFYQNNFINHYKIKACGSWNCLAFAESYKVVANLYHTQFIDSKSPAISVGNAFYKENQNGHVASLCIYVDDNTIKLNFLDFLGNFKFLKTQEIKSIELIIF